MDEAQKEADYKKELQDAGVEIPVDDSVESEKVEETPEAPEADKKAEEAEKPNESESREPRKRSIYDDYKDKKVELKSEREQREQAEHERDELKRQLEEVSQANSPEHKASPNGLLEYAEQAGADPELVKRIVEEARNGQQQIDPELKGRLERFENWQKQNASVLEKQMFEEEFNRTVPTLQSMFPTANTEELGTLKSELDKLSHSKEMHDKELDYVAFKHREHLSAFVSPKKVGMESKGRNQVGDNSSEFNPTADLTKMNAKELDAYEASYRKMVSEQGGVSGTGKNKILL